MRTRQIILRWLPTFLAFPLAGLFASLAFGPIDSPLEAAVAGANLGAILGISQWWALKPLGVTLDWFWSTAIAAMIASPFAWAVVAFSTSIEALSVWGLIAGAIVGCAQALSQRLKWERVLIWAGLVSATWGLAWLISANVIVDADSNYAVFGSTGAIVATSVLSFFLNPLLVTKR